VSGLGFLGVGRIKLLTVSPTYPSDVRALIEVVETWAGAAPRQVETTLRTGQASEGQLAVLLSFQRHATRTDYVSMLVFRQHNQDCFLFPYAGVAAVPESALAVKYAGSASSYAPTVSLQRFREAAVAK
jgi:hypothetical protein